MQLGLINDPKLPTPISVPLAFGEVLVINLPHFHIIISVVVTYLIY